MCPVKAREKHTEQHNIYVNFQVQEPALMLQQPKPNKRLDELCTIFSQLYTQYITNIREKTSSLII